MSTLFPSWKTGLERGRIRIGKGVGTGCFSTQLGNVGKGVGTGCFSTRLGERCWHRLL